jgi:glucan phosphoethanolaminetransferase (alkaline phosphatase superfamily)
MFSAGGLTMIFGVLFAILCIVLFIWYVNTRIQSKNQQEWLTRFTAILLTALLGLFIVDKVIAFKIPLLSPQMSDELFNLIKNIVLIIFGYQFNRTKQVETKEEEKK